MFDSSDFFVLCFLPSTADDVIGPTRSSKSTAAYRTSIRHTSFVPYQHHQDLQQRHQSLLVSILVHCNGSSESIDIVPPPTVPSFSSPRSCLTATQHAAIDAPVWFCDSIEWSVSFQTSSRRRKINSMAVVSICSSLSSSAAARSLPSSRAKHHQTTSVPHSDPIRFYRDTSSQA